MQAAGLIDLWQEGYVEPIQPPAEPYHILAQQLMALVLQEPGIGRYTWLEWIAGVPGFTNLPGEAHPGGRRVDARPGDALGRTGNFGDRAEG